MSLAVARRFNASAGQPVQRQVLVSRRNPGRLKPHRAFSKPDTENFDSAIGRIDHSFRQSDKLSGRYEFDRFTKAAVFNPSSLSLTRTPLLRSPRKLFGARNPCFLSASPQRFPFQLLARSLPPRPWIQCVNATAFGVSLPFQPTPNAIQGVGVQGGFSFGDNPAASSLVITIRGPTTSVGKRASTIFTSACPWSAAWST